MKQGSPSNRAPDLAFDELSDTLKALANPNRLELLHQLRFPRAVSEIALTPKRAEPGGNPNRLISRQAVERHLGVLEDIGVVRALPSERDGRPVDEYVVNHANVFAVVEDLRKLSLIKPIAMLDAGATQGAEPRVANGGRSTTSIAKVRGPRLILVGGVWEGRAYPLDASEGQHEWVIGRREGADVRLDYDPFVSGENTRLLQKDGRWFVEDEPESRNGTHLNYEPLDRGARVPIETGDLISLGRSVLLFRET